MIPVIRGLYKHKKGNIYQVITVAECTKTTSTLVIYKSSFSYSSYATPLEMFNSEFEYIKGDDR